MDDSGARRLSRLLQLASGDHVAVVIARIGAGERYRVGEADIVAERDLGLGHKVAVTPIAAGEKVLKYGAPIGRATRDIAPGEHVHVHNLASDYTPTYVLPGDSGS